MIERYKKWHKKQHKLIRFTLRVLWLVVLAATSIIWIPALFVLWFVTSVLLEILELWENS